MRLLLALAALAVLTAGCMCGPQVSTVEAAAFLDATFEGNKTAYRQALEQAGFAVDEASYGTVHGVKGHDEVFVRRHYEQLNVTEVDMTFHVPDREFRDDESGSNQARSYIAGESAKAQPRADAYASLLRQAVGAPPGPGPTVNGTYAIC